MRAPTQSCSTALYAKAPNSSDLCWPDLPAPLLAPLAGAMTSVNDLQAGNVPGSSDELYLAGARIERIYPFAPVPGCAAMICLHTYRNMCCIGANLDSAAISDTDGFTRCLQRGFSEVLNLVDGAADPAIVT
jgi:diacylglycerol O-acyltransferase / wax synthase